MYSFVKQHVVVMGSTGNIGSQLSQSLLKLGHDVTMVTRSIHGKHEEFLTECKNNGAHVVEVADLTDRAELKKIFQNKDIVISAIPGTAKSIELEYIWLDVALQEKVQRFVPTEFGLHTANVDYGVGIVFDAKKQLHEKIYNADINYTFFYNGGIFDYMIPNLRYNPEIITCGDLDIQIYTHDIRDIGMVAAMALTDPRTVNKCVQMNYSSLSQRQMLDIINTTFPQAPLVYKHYSSPWIAQKRQEVNTNVETLQGSETEQERWGINYAIYVLNELTAFTANTLATTDLYPEYKLIRTPQEALQDPLFTLGKKYED